MPDFRITIRLSEAERQALENKATAAGITASQMARALLSQPPAGATIDVLAESIAAIAARLDGIEEHLAGASASAAIEPILGDLAARQAETEAAVSHLVRAVEKVLGASQRPVLNHGQRQHGQQQDGAPAVQEKRYPPEPVGGWDRWASEQPMLPGETPSDRARRLRPEYNARHGLPAPAVK